MPLINKLSSALATAIAPPNNAPDGEGILSVHAIYLGSVKVRPRDIVTALSRLAIDSSGSSTVNSSSFSWNTSANAGRRSRAALLSSAASGRSGRSSISLNTLSKSESTNTTSEISSISVSITPKRAQELPVVALCADALALELVGHALGNIRAEFDSLRFIKSRRGSSSHSSSIPSKSKSMRSKINALDAKIDSYEEEEEEEDSLERDEKGFDTKDEKNMFTEKTRSHDRRVSHLKKLARAIERRTIALEAQLRPHGVTASDYSRGRAEILNRWALASLPPLPSLSSTHDDSVAVSVPAPVITSVSTSVPTRSSTRASTRSPTPEPGKPSNSLDTSDRDEHSRDAVFLLPTTNISKQTLESLETLNTKRNNMEAVEAEATATPIVSTLSSTLRVDNQTKSNVKDSVVYVPPAAAALAVNETIPNKKLQHRDTNQERNISEVTPVVLAVPVVSANLITPAAPVTAVTSVSSTSSLESQKRMANETAVALSALQDAVVAVSRSEHRAVVENEISALWQERVRVSDLSRLDAEQRCESLGAQLKNASNSLASLQRRLTLLEDERMKALQAAETQQQVAQEAKERLAIALQTYSVAQKDQQNNFERAVETKVAQAMERHSETTEKEFSTKLSLIIAERNAGLSVLQELRDAEMEAERVISSRLQNELQEARDVATSAQEELVRLRKETEMMRLEILKKVEEKELERHMEDTEAHDAIAAAAAAVKGHERTIEELTRELQLALKDCDELSTAENEAELAREEAELAREEADNLRVTVNSLQEKVISLTLDNRMSEAKYSSLEHQITELHTNVQEKINEEIKNKEANVDRISFEKASLEAQINKLHDELQISLRETEIAKNIAEMSKKDVETLNKNLNDAKEREKVALLDADLVKHELEMTKKDVIDTRVAAQSSMNELLAAKEEEEKKLQEICNSLTIKCMKLESLASESIQKQEITNSLIKEELQQKILQLQTQIDNLNNLRISEAAVTSILSSEKDSLEISLVNLTSKNAALERSLTEANNAVKGTEADLLQKLYTEQERLHKLEQDLIYERTKFAKLSQKIEEAHKTEIESIKIIEERSAAVISLELKIKTLTEERERDALLFATEKGTLKEEIIQLRNDSIIAQSNAQSLFSSQIEQLTLENREQIDQIELLHVEKLKTIRTEVNEQTEGRLDVLRMTHETALKALKAQVDLRVESSEIELRQLRDELSFAKQQALVEMNELKQALLDSRASLVVVEYALEEEKKMRKAADERASAVFANRSLNNKAKEEEVDKLRSRIENLVSQLQQEESEVERLRKSLLDATNQITTQVIEIESLRQRVSDVENLIHQKESLIETEKVQLVKLMGSLKESNDALDIERKERIRIKAAAEEEIEKISKSLFEEKQRLDANVAIATTSAAAAEGAAWETAVRSYLDSLHSYSRSLRECDAEMISSSSSSSSSSSAVGQVDNSDMDPLNSSISSTSTASANHQFSSILSSALAEADDDTGLQVLFKKAVSDLVETVCAHYSQRVTAVTARVERYSARSNERWRSDARTELEASFKARVSEIEEHSRIAVLTAESVKNDLNVKIATLESSIKRLENEKANAIDRLEKVEIEREKLFDRITIHEDERADLLNQIADLKVELTHSQEDLQDLKALLVDSKRELAETISLHEIAIHEATLALTEAKADLKSAVSGFEARLRTEREEAEQLMHKAIQDAVEIERNSHNTSLHSSHAVNTTQNAIRNALVGGNSTSVGSAILSPSEQQHNPPLSTSPGTFISPALSTPAGLWLSSPSPLSASTSTTIQPHNQASFVNASGNNSILIDTNTHKGHSDEAFNAMRTSAAYPAFSRRRDSVQQQLDYSRRQSQDSTSTRSLVGGGGGGGFDTGSTNTYPLPSATELAAVKRKVVELSEGVRERDGLLTSAEREMAVLYERLAEAVQTIDVLQGRLLSSPRKGESPTTLVPKELLDESLRQINAARAVFSRESQKGLDAFRQRKKDSDEQGLVEVTDLESKWIEIVTDADPISSTVSTTTSLKLLYHLVQDILRAARVAGASTPAASSLGSDITSGSNSIDISSSNDILEDLLREADRHDVKSSNHNTDDGSVILTAAIEGLKGSANSGTVTSSSSSVAKCMIEMRRVLAKAALIYSKSLQRMQASLHGKDLLNLTLQSETIAYEGMLVQARRMSISQSQGSNY
jgi:hypothetical protein